MKNKYTLVLFTILSTNLLAQVGINNSNPNATLEVSASPRLSTADGIIAPKLTGLELKNKDKSYLEKQTGSIVYVTEALTNTTTSPKTINVTSIGYYYFDGSVWQKINSGKNSTSNLNATNGLTKTGSDIKLGGKLNEVTSIDTSSDNTLKLNGLEEKPISNNKILTIDSDNNVRVSSNISNDLSIPTPAIFQLNEPMENFLEKAKTGEKETVNMELIKNTIPNLRFFESTKMISFPPGIYQMTFTYEATQTTTVI